MNLSNCSYNKRNIENKLLPALYTITFIIGFVGNAWGLKLLMQKWQKLGNINVFVLNLGLANILYLFTLPFLMVYYFSGGKWIFGDVFCKMTRFCFNVNLYCSIGFLTCISVYRYLAIVHPLRMMGRLTVTRSVLISVLVWLLVSVQSMPDIFFPKRFKDKAQCFHSTSLEKTEDYLTYSLVRKPTMPPVLTPGVTVLASTVTEESLKPSTSFGKSSSGLTWTGMFGGLLLPARSVPSPSAPTYLPLGSSILCPLHTVPGPTLLWISSPDCPPLKATRLVWTTTGFCIPLLITLGCYGHVTFVLCRRNTIEKTLRQKCLKFLFILILLFSVCYIPYHVFRNLSLFSRIQSKQNICVWWDKHVFTGHQISRGLVCLNSALNPLVYLQMSEHILTHIRQLPQQVCKIFHNMFVSRDGIYGSLEGAESFSKSHSKD
uniref:Si:dkey-78k11.9 n=1 Tax=Oryzias latipes TaxID=8090 RepID=A0A3P9H090_ORYLA